MAVDLIFRVEEASGTPIALARVLGALGLPSDPPSEGPDRPRGVEVGRAATGATVFLEPGPSAATAGCDPFLPLEQLRAPLLRAPSFAADALEPVLLALASLGAVVRPVDRAGTLGDPARPEAATALWRSERARAAQELVTLCRDTGAPPPPHLPAADLEALHAWLLAAAEAEIDGGPAPAHPFFCLDARDGGPVRCAVALPARGTVRVPAGLDLLVTSDGETRAIGPEWHTEAAVDAPRDPLGFLVVDLDGAAGRALAASPGVPLTRFRTVAPVEVIDDETLFAEAGHDPGR